MAPALRLVGTIVVAVAVVASASLLAGAVVRAKGNAEAITVTGSARRLVTADTAIWSARLSRRAPQIGAGYAAVKADADRLIAYLTKAGFSSKEIVRGAIQTRTLFQAPPAGQSESGDSYRPVEGYDVSQSVEVRSENVARVEAISRESTELLAQGVALESQSPQYLYTKVTDAKREILGEAAEDALKRAQLIARKAGSDVGAVRSARMSPLQITPATSMSVEGEGQNDTTSIEKALTAIVTLTFAVK